jgi:hypothetical protein
MKSGSPFVLALAAVLAACGDSGTGPTSVAPAATTSPVSTAPAAAPAPAVSESAPAAPATAAESPAAAPATAAASAAQGEKRLFVTVLASAED